MIKSEQRKVFTKISHKTDFCVVGGGLAGVFAAVSAARAGCRVVLMQDRPVLGGNCSSEIRMWIRGAHGENVRETGLLEEAALANLYRNPSMNFSIWDSILYEMVLNENNIELLLNCSCNDAVMENRKIVSVTGWQTTTQTWHIVEAKIFADCSGDSVLAPITGAAFRMGREAAEEFNESIEPEKSDEYTMGMSCLIQARECDRPKRYTPPKWANKYKAEDFLHRMNLTDKDAWKKDNFWWMELGGVNDSIRDTEKLREELLKVAFGVWDYVKNVGSLNADNWDLEWVGFLPGKRESRRYEGAHILTQNDVRSGEIYEDIIAYGGWSMDDHNPQGFATSEEPTIYHEAPSPYAIPYRCIFSKNIENLMFAGRNISTTHAALASTRVMATCALLGQAVGTAAGICIKDNQLPRELYPNQMEKLKQRLIEDDCYLPGNKRKLPALMSQIEMKSLYGNIECLTDGIERIVDGIDHVWEAPIGTEIIMEAPKCVPMEEMRIVFDSDLNRNSFSEHCQMVRQFPMVCQIFSDQREVYPPITLVKAFAIWGDSGNGKWELIKMETNNYQRLAKIKIGKNYQKLKIELNETWGSESVRVYALDVK